MKSFFIKFYVLFVLIFFHSFVFSMQDDSQDQVLYDIQAYERLKNFESGEECNNNLFEKQNFRSTFLERMGLDNIILKECFFDNSRLKCSAFGHDSQLLNLSFTKALFEGAVFDNSEIENTDFSNTGFVGSAFNNSIISKSTFKDATFVNCKFSNMRIDAKKGKKCFIYNNNFDFALFKFCDFRWVGFRKNSFVGAIFENTAFQKCFIFGADFARSSFRDVIFENCVFVDCKNLSLALFTKNVVFNFCEFVEENASSRQIEKLIFDIENQGAKVVKKAGKWKKFKNIAGAMIGLTGRIGVNIAAGASYEFGKSIFSACNKVCYAWLAQNNQGCCPVQSVSQDN